MDTSPTIIRKRKSYGKLIKEGVFDLINFIFSCSLPYREDGKFCKLEII